MKILLSTILLLGAVMTAGATEVPQVTNILGRMTSRCSQLVRNVGWK